MLYLVIGLFVAVAAVGAFFRQQGRHPAPEEAAHEAGEASAAPEAAKEQPASIATLKDDTVPMNPTQAAKPISSPITTATATYVSEGRDSSPYAYGKSEKADKEKGADKPLLRWCGRSGSVEAGGSVLLGPIIYWSNGQAPVDEPSCVDVTLPVEYPKEGELLPTDGAASYKEMTPLQRGIYLTWLAGGRIQPPVHACYPTIWLYGLERRAIVDRLDLGICLAEGFRMLPLMRWDAMRENLIHFITWLAVKMWLPENDLLSFCKRLHTVPDGLFGVMLGSYANSRLPLPSPVAFTMMRASETLRAAALGEKAAEFSHVAHSDDLMRQFSSQYKTACKGGLVLDKPKSSLSLNYIPTNPSLPKDEKDGGQKSAGILEIPNFFEDLQPFQPLFSVWRDFAPKLVRRLAPTTALESLEERPDFEGFIDGIKQANGSDDAPLLATLSDLGALMKLDTSAEGGKPHGRDRKTMIEIAQVEGYQIVPNLGLSGRDYRWEDKVLFLPLEPGTQLSQAYNAASFLLEFLCSVTAAREQRLFQPLRQRLNDYFPALSTEDNVRLESQGVLDLPAPYPPEFYGEAVQVWLQDDGRAALRNFLMDFLSFLPGMDTEALAAKLSAALGIAVETPPALEERPTAERGAEVLKLLAPLFKV